MRACCPTMTCPLWAGQLPTRMEQAVQGERGAAPDWALESCPEGTLWLAEACFWPPRGRPPCVHLLCSLCVLQVREAQAPWPRLGLEQLLRPLPQGSLLTACEGVRQTSRSPSFKEEPQWQSPVLPTSCTAAHPVVGTQTCGHRRRAQLRRARCLENMSERHTDGRERDERASKQAIFYLPLTLGIPAALGMGQAWSWEPGPGLSQHHHTPPGVHTRESAGLGCRLCTGVLTCLEASHLAPALFSTSQGHGSPEAWRGGRGSAVVPGRDAAGTQSISSRCPQEAGTSQTAGWWWFFCRVSTTFRVKSL